MINEKNAAFRHKEIYVLDFIKFKLLQFITDKISTAPQAVRVRGRNTKDLSFLYS